MKELEQIKYYSDLISEYRRRMTLNGGVEGVSQDKVDKLRKQLESGNIGISEFLERVLEQSPDSITGA